MLQNYKVAIVDTSCLIILSKIDELDILRQLFETVIVTPVIVNEFLDELPNWILIKSPLDEWYQSILMFELDEGEASAIALTIENPNSILIVDDLKARNVVDKLKISYTGTFGLIIKAKELVVIDSVKRIIDKIRKTNFRFNEHLLQSVIQQAGE